MNPNRIDSTLAWEVTIKECQAELQAHKDYWDMVEKYKKLDHDLARLIQLGIITQNHFAEKARLENRPLLSIAEQQSLNDIASLIDKTRQQKERMAKNLFDIRMKDGAIGALQDKIDELRKKIEEFHQQEERQQQIRKENYQVEKTARDKISVALETTVEQIFGVFYAISRFIMTTYNLAADISTSIIKPIALAFFGALYIWDVYINYKDKLAGQYKTRLGKSIASLLLSIATTVVFFFVAANPIGLMVLMIASMVVELYKESYIAHQLYLSPLNTPEHHEKVFQATRKVVFSAFSIVCGILLVAGLAFPPLLIPAAILLIGHAILDAIDKRTNFALSRGVVKLAKTVGDAFGKLFNKIAAAVNRKFVSPKPKHGLPPTQQRQQRLVTEPKQSGRGPGGLPPKYESPLNFEKNPKAALKQGSGPTPKQGSGPAPKQGSGPLPKNDAKFSQPIHQGDTVSVLHSFLEQKSAGVTVMKRRETTVDMGMQDIDKKHSTGAVPVVPHILVEEPDVSNTPLLQRKRTILTNMSFIGHQHPVADSGKAPSTPTTAPTERKTEDDGEGEKDSHHPHK